MLLEKTHYSLYSSCCSSPEKARYGYFSAKNAHFPAPIYSTPNLKMFPLHCIHEILYAESIDAELTNYRAKSFPL